VTLDLFTALTVLPPPSGAHVVRDLVYMSDARGPLHADVYRPSTLSRAPAVFLVNGDAPEEVIARAKDWGVYRSYGEHLAARGLVGVPFNHRSRQAIGGTMGDATRALAASVRAVIEVTRSHASDLGIDPEKVGVWAFSAAGPFGPAPLLREPPVWLRAIAGFYTIWDLAPYRDLDDPPGEEEIRE
jgi:acetyl esterase/lipase